MLVGKVVLILLSGPVVAMTAILVGQLYALILFLLFRFSWRSKSLRCHPSTASAARLRGERVRGRDNVAREDGQARAGVGIVEVEVHDAAAWCRPTT